MILITSGSSAYAISDQFGHGTGPIFMKEVGCTGQEQYLNNCSYNPFTSTECTHSNDVGVKCEGILFNKIIF